GRWRLRPDGRAPRGGTLGAPSGGPVSLLLLLACGVPEPAGAALAVGPATHHVRPAPLPSWIGGRVDPVPESPLDAARCGELTSGGGTVGACLTAEVGCG